MSSSTVSEPLSPASFVTLSGGPTVRVEAIVLLNDLIARGAKIETDGVDLLVHKSSTVTEEDRQALRRFKAHVIALLGYVERIQ